MMKQVDSKFEFTTFALWKKIFLYLYWIENYRMSGCDFFCILFVRNMLAAYFESFCRKKKGAHDNCRAIKHAKCASNAIRISDYAVTSREIIAGNPFSDSHKHDTEKSRLVFSLLALKFNSRISFSQRFLFVHKSLRV